jgi:flagellar hook protein FlgE
MSSIMASLTGIQAHQFMLDVIGNNLSNANTTGYKSARVTFSEMMNQTLRPAAAGSDNLGGVNPVQIGLGVEVGSVTRDFSQGRLQDTGNPLDLSMDGAGFMCLNDGTRTLFTRSTTFSLDANSYLVDSVSGYRLYSTENTPIRIPYDDQIPAQKTTEIDCAGNLTTGADVPQAEVLASIGAFTSGGAPATAATDLNDLTTNSADYADGDSILLTGTRTDGSPFTPVVFTYGAGNDGTTLGDIVNTINSIYGAEATATLDADGRITLTAAEVGPSSLSLQMSDNGGVSHTDWTQHALYVQSDGANGGEHRISSTVYDSRGEAHILSMTFQRTGEREWTMLATLSDSTGTLTKSTIENIRFNTDGSFNSVGEGGANAQQLVIDYGTAAEPQTIMFDFGTSGGFGGLTLFGGNSTAAAMGQNGFAPGTLKSFNIGRDGVIQGLYTNGQRQDISQIRIASFDNPEGLESMGGGKWAETVNSGDPIYGTAMSGRSGAIVSASLEGSNVDTAEELTKLIIAQHGFQMSTRAMSVSSRTLQELAQSI